MTTSAQIEQLLNQHDCEWEHQEELPLGSIDLVASITNQSRFEPIDQPTVDPRRSQRMSLSSKTRSTA